MTNSWKGVGSLLAFFSALWAFGLVGCAGREPAKPVSSMNNPDHYYNNGIKFLDKGEYDNALLEFESAKALEPKYSRAYMGIGLVKAYQGDFGAAFASMKRVRSLDGVYAHVGMIRLCSMQRSEGWLEKAEDEFEAGKEKDDSSPDLHFYMGKAYEIAFEFDKAAACFKKVVDLNEGFVAEANQEWTLVQKIQRTAPRSKIGKQIALAEKVTRADLAALFIEELNLDQLYEGGKVKGYDPSLKPLEVASFSSDSVPVGVDASDHPLKGYIDAVIRLGVRGLEPFPDRTFAPAMPISKANYAMMVEDILVKVSGDEKLATEFVDASSPFLDVRPDHYAFNSVMVCTTRGIMEARLGGYFGTEDPVSGADALLVIRRLQEELKQ